MKRWGWVLLAGVVGCKSAAERTFDNALIQGAAYESQGRWAEAVDLYEQARPAAREIEKEAEIEKRESAAFPNALADAKSADQRGDFREVLRMVRLVRAAAVRYGSREAVDDLLLRNELEDAVQRARAMAQAGDYRQAILTLRTFRESAKRTGRTEEVERLARETFESGVARADQMHSHREFRPAIDLYVQLESVAAEFGRKSEMAEKAQAARVALVESGVAEAKANEEARRWSQAAAVYESILDVAREIGRGQEIDRCARRARFEAGMAEGLALESAGRWEEAIGLYESLRSLAADDEASRRVGEKLQAAHQQFVANAISEMESMLEAGRFVEAIAYSRRVEPSAGVVGRSDELRDLVRQAKTGRLDELLDAIARCRRRDQFDEGLRLLQEARVLADELGRRAEVDEQARELRQEQYESTMARGAQWEREGRWEDALQLYESSRGLALELGVEPDLANRILQARTLQYDSWIARARALEQEQRWEEAVKSYDRCGPMAGLLGREGELRRTSRWSREMVHGGGLFYEDFDCLRTFRLDAEITAAAISPPQKENQFFAACDAGGRIHVWQVGTFERVFGYQSKAQFSDIVFSPNREYVAASDNFTRVRVWDFRFRDTLDSLEHGSAVNSCDYSPDGLFLVSGCEDGTVYLWKWRDKKHEAQRVAIYAGHVGPVKHVRFLNDVQFVSSSVDGTVRVWDVGGTECHKVVEAHQGACCSMNYEAKQGHVLTVGHDDHHVRAWKTADWSNPRALECGEAHVATYDGLNRYIVTGQTNGEVCVWDAVTGKNCRTFRGHRSEIVRILCTPDGQYVISMSRDGTICVWGQRE